MNIIDGTWNACLSAIFTMKRLIHSFAASAALLAVSAFAHADVTALIQTDSGNTSLGVESYGSGTVYVGGLTAPTFDFENNQSGAYQLLDNLLAVGGAGPGQAAYVSDGPSDQPWGLSDFESAMTNDYGAGGYADDTFSVGASVFNSDYSFIFIEGGDGTASDFDAFFTPSVIAAEQAWVSAGGTLVINGGRWPNNTPSGYDIVNVGFGVALDGAYDYSLASYGGTAVDPSLPLFNGAGSYWQGNYFSHDIVIAAPDSASTLALLGAGLFGLGLLARRRGFALQA